MQALRAEKPEKALFVSPVVDMETLILSMMQGAHVTEERLKAAGEIPTEMGETLSWLYLCWVREHPLQWHTPTQVLYGDKDALTSRAVMERFRRQSGAHLTILQGGDTGSTPRCSWLPWKAGRPGTYNKNAADGL